MCETAYRFEISYGYVGYTLEKSQPYPQNDEHLYFKSRLPVMMPSMVDQTEMVFSSGSNNADSFPPMPQPVSMPIQWSRIIGTVRGM